MLAGRDLLALPEAGMKDIRGNDVAMIFQEPMTALNPVVPVGRQIDEVLRAHTSLDARTRKKRILDMMEQVRLPQVERIFASYPHRLSGGQRQRIAIARALASNAEFIVCDEPTSALDVSVQAQILNLMRDLQDKFGLTYLFISHNLAVVRHMASRIGVMYLGRIVEIAEGRQLFSAPRMPYTKMLLGAVPDLAMSGRQRIPVK
ncbi:hypothetical protein KXV61_008297, partial [Aspergillus fumigatus]